MRSVLNYFWDTRLDNSTRLTRGEWGRTGKGGVVVPVTIWTWCWVDGTVLVGRGKIWIESDGGPNIRIWNEISWEIQRDGLVCLKWFGSFVFFPIWVVMSYQYGFNGSTRPFSAFGERGRHKSPSLPSIQSWTMPMYYSPNSHKKPSFFNSTYPSSPSSILIATQEL